MLCNIWCEKLKRKFFNRSSRHRPSLLFLFFLRHSNLDTFQVSETLETRFFSLNKIPSCETFLMLFSTRFHEGDSKSRRKEF